jgi:hypothetical protein
MGAYGDAETAGGGRIVVIADSIVTDNTNVKISSNGFPVFDDDNDHLDALSGGSGGYVYIHTKNHLNQNSVNLST